jgi:hypothetical protein
VNEIRRWISELRNRDTKAVIVKLNRAAHSSCRYPSPTSGRVASAASRVGLLIHRRRVTSPPPFGRTLPFQERDATNTVGLNVRIHF